MGCLNEREKRGRKKHESTNNLVQSVCERYSRIKLNNRTKPKLGLLWTTQCQKEVPPLWNYLSFNLFLYNSRMILTNALTSGIPWLIIYCWLGGTNDIPGGRLGTLAADLKNKNTQLQIKPWFKILWQILINTHSAFYGDINVYELTAGISISLRLNKPLHTAEWCTTADLVTWQALCEKTHTAQVK